MRPVLAVLVWFAGSTIPVLHAQGDYYARVGLTWSTELIQDVVIEELEIQPKLAPTLVLGASLPFAPTYRAGLEAMLTSSGYRSRAQGLERDLGTLRTIAGMLGLEGPIGGRLNWRAGVGLLRYLPDEDQGVFLRGGSTRFLVGAGIDFRPPVMRQWDLMVSLRYDFHRFTTGELTARGFSGGQGVQRVSAGIGLARGRR